MRAMIIPVMDCECGRSIWLKIASNGCCPEQLFLLQVRKLHHLSMVGKNDRDCWRCSRMQHIPYRSLEQMAWQQEQHPAVPWPDRHRQETAARTGRKSALPSPGLLTLNAPHLPRKPPSHHSCRPPHSIALQPQAVPRSLQPLSGMPSEGRSPGRLSQLSPAQRGILSLLISYSPTLWPADHTSGPMGALR